MTTIQKRFELQKRVITILKDKNNEHFKSHYFDINDVLTMLRPILNDLGLVLDQPIRGSVIKTIITNVDNAEVAVESEMDLPNVTNPQHLGSAITYFRRYMLQSALALEAADDDANVASKAPQDNRKWLNLKTKDGLTATYNALKARIDKGEVISIDSIEKHYKLSKDVRQILMDDFNIM